MFKLIHNYRSLPSILNYYNTQFYDSQLVAMNDSKTSPDAEMLTRFNSIFLDENQTSEYGIHFVDVNGKNVVRKHSWANILEAQVVSNIIKPFLFIDTWHLACKLRWIFSFITNRLRGLWVG